MSETTKKARDEYMVKTIAIAVAIALFAIVIMWAICLTMIPRTQEASGSAVTSSASAQSELDAAAAASAMTVNFPEKIYVGTDAKAHVAFSVPAGNNGISERMTISQNGVVLYESAPVVPGGSLDAVFEGLHDGAAGVSIRGISSDGVEGGSVNFTVRVVEEA